MITIPVARTCPVTEATWGVVKVPEKLIAELTFALEETSHEFMIFLLGEYEDDRRLTVWVKDRFVPRGQKRSRAGVELDDNYKLPGQIAENVVGVLHTHPGYHYGQNGVGFSTTDHGREGFNRRWPLSVVVGLGSSISPEDIVWGLRYEIVGNHRLPCGAWGMCHYKMVPCDKNGVIDPDWVTPVQVVVPDLTLEGWKRHEDLGDCHKYSVTEDSTRYLRTRKSDCGLEETDAHYVSGAFGYSADLFKDLPPPIKEKSRNGYSGRYPAFDY